MNEVRRKPRGSVRSHKVSQLDLIPLIQPEGQGIQSSAGIKSQFSFIFPVRLRKK